MDKKSYLLKTACIFMALLLFMGCPDTQGPNTILKGASSTNTIKQTGKVAFKLDLGQNINIIPDSSDFIKINSLRTVATIDDIEKIKITVECPKCPKLGVTKEIEKTNITSQQKIVIKDLPVGPADVTVALLDKNGNVLQNQKKTEPVTVVADEVKEVEFIFKLTNDPQKKAQTGSLDISVKVNESTSLYGLLELEKRNVKVGESITIRIIELNGEVTGYQFDTGDGTDVKMRSNPSITYTFTKKGRFPVKVRLDGNNGETYTIDPVYIIVEDDTTTQPITESSASVIVTSTPQPSENTSTSEQPIQENNPSSSSTTTTDPIRDMPI